MYPATWSGMTVVSEGFASNFVQVSALIRSVGIWLIPTVSGRIL
jgi:hypothetical protein